MCPFTFFLTRQSRNACGAAAFPPRGFAMQRTHRPCDVFQKQGVIFMHAIQHHARGVLSAAAIATAALVGGTFATPASAQWASDNYAPYAAPATGVVVGTLAGVGLYNGWYGSS